jgi:MbtH protein
MSGLRSMWGLPIGLVVRIPGFSSVMTTNVFQVLVEWPKSVLSHCEDRLNERRYAPTMLRSAILGMVLTVASACLNQAVLAQDSTEEPGFRNQVALPEQISVVVPDAGVSNEFAAFSGAWSGDGWNRIIPAALVVETIDPGGSAQVIFSWGDVAASKRARGWLRLPAMIREGRLVLSVPNHGTVEFNIAVDGKLYGRYILPTGRRDYALLSRLPMAERGAILAAKANRLPSCQGVYAGLNWFVQGSLRFRIRCPRRNVMAVDDQEDTKQYTVVMNHEEQYSIWPTGKQIPGGWVAVGKEGFKAECLQYIEEVWVDMRPLSLRKKMEALEGGTDGA